MNLLIAWQPGKKIIKQMPDYTLYSNFRSRGLVPRALVNYFKLDVKIVDPYTINEQFEKEFPLRKLPDLLGPDGFKLTEQIAINHFLINLAGKPKIKAQLLGDQNDFKTQAKILRWESLGNSDLIITRAKITLPLTDPETPLVEKEVEAAWKTLNKIVGIYEEALGESAFLVGDHITLGDLVSASAFTKCFTVIFGSRWREEHSVLVNWFTAVINSEFLKDEYRDFEFVDEVPKLLRFL